MWLSCVDTKELLHLDVSIGYIVCLYVSCCMLEYNHWVCVLTDLKVLLLLNYLLPCLFIWCPLNWEAHLLSSTNVLLDLNLETPCYIDSFWTLYSALKLSFIAYVDIWAMCWYYVVLILSWEKLWNISPYRKYLSWFRENFYGLHCT